MMDLEALARSHLTAEFDRAWRNRTQNHRAHLADSGITFEASSAMASPP